MIAKLIGISDLEEANHFLRALWAELRSKFPHCAWHFNPFKVGKMQYINIGSLSIGSPGGVVNISMTYKTRGGIECIAFDQFGPASLEPDSELGVSLSSAADRALERAPYPHVGTMTGWIRSADLPLGNYAGRSFNIVRVSDSVSCVTMSVEYYDDRDAHLEFKRKMNQCIDLLAVETGNLFWEVQGPSEETPCPSAPKDLFVKNPNWIDYSPLTEGHLLISPEGKKFIGFIAENGLASPDRATLLQAMRLHHAAARLEAQLGEHRQIMGKDLPAISHVLLLSALEAASTIGMATPQSCEACGQPLYKIRQRVGDLVAKYHASPPDGMIVVLGIEGAYYEDPKTGKRIDPDMEEAAEEFGPNPFIKKILMKAYDERSKFLHKGEPMTDHAYGWFDCIPQLDPSDPRGFNTLSIGPGWELGKLTGHCLRQVLKECCRNDSPNPETAHQQDLQNDHTKRASMPIISG